MLKFYLKFLQRNYIINIFLGCLISKNQKVKKQILWVKYLFHRGKHLIMISFCCISDRVSHTLPSLHRHEQKVVKIREKWNPI